jgi:DNA repair exonuclease SbcCD ATPase subunit
MRLLGITLKNFRSFVDEQTVTFPDSGLVLLKGLNRDSGGSSGSGKSSILLAISHLLGYCPFSATSLNGWRSEEPLRVKGTFEIKGAIVEIQRDGSKLSLWVNGIKQKGGAAQLERQLSDLIGVKPDVLGALTYRAQRTSSLFLSMTDSEKKQFLSDLLNLDRFERLADQATKELGALTGKLSVLRAVVDSQRIAIPPEPPDLVLIDVDVLDRQIKALKQQIEKLVQDREHLVKIIDTNKSTIEQKSRSIKLSYQPEISRLEQELKSILGRNLVPEQQDTALFTDRLEKIEKKIREHQDEQQNQLRQATQKLKQLNQEAAVWRRQADGRLVAMDRLKQIEAEITSIAFNLCPTCSQTWTAGQEQVKQLDREAEECRAKISDGLKSLESLKICETIEIPKIQEKIEKLQCIEIPPNLTVARDKLKGALATAVANQKVATSALQNQQLQDQIKTQKQIDDLKQKMTQELDKEVKTLEQDVVGLTQAAGLLDAEINHLKSRNRDLSHQYLDAERSNQNALSMRQQSLDMRQRAIKTLSDKTQELEEAGREYDLLKEFIKLVGREGFLGIICDDVLAEIAALSNTRLSHLPNVQAITLAFQTSRDLKDGSQRNEIKTCLMLDGREVPLASLSGGQQTAVEMAVDRSVAEVIARRTGVRPNWLVLDEAFEGMDGVVKEQCFEMLKQQATEQLILVVDHAEQFIHLFDQTIEVEYQNGISRVLSYRHEESFSTASPPAQELG